MNPRENPFRVDKQHELRFRFQGTDWSRFLSLIKQHQYRGAVVGPHGSGKTTLMLELVDRIRDLGEDPNYLRINSETRSEVKSLIANWLSFANEDQILILDGAEQLRYWGWRRFSSQVNQYRGLLITTHSAGRMPTLYETRTDLDLLKSLVRELVDDDIACKESLADLFKKQNGNLRECLRSLYEIAANQ